MNSLKLQFSLVGKVGAYKREIPKAKQEMWSNSSSLDYVLGVVSTYFGDRALVVSGEETLCNEALTYPAYYCAGAFTGLKDGKQAELVVVAHGSSMEDAHRKMIDATKGTTIEQMAVIG